MNDSAYHAARARAEIEAAYGSQSSKAASVHLVLCALHLEKAKAASSRTTLGSSWEITWLERAATFHRGCIAAASNDTAWAESMGLSAGIVREQSGEQMLRQL